MQISSGFQMTSPKLPKPALSALDHQPAQYTRKTQGCLSLLHNAEQCYIKPRSIPQFYESVPLSFLPATILL